MNDTPSFWPGLPGALTGAGRLDRIEIKAVIAADRFASAATALGADPARTQLRQVYYFDTPDLRLHALAFFTGTPIPERDSCPAR